MIEYQKSPQPLDVRIPVLSSYEIMVLTTESQYLRTSCRIRVFSNCWACYEQFIKIPPTNFEVHLKKCIPWRINLGEKHVSSPKWSFALPVSAFIPFAL